MTIAERWARTDFDFLSVRPAKAAAKGVRNGATDWENIELGKPISNCFASLMNDLGNPQSGLYFFPRVQMASAPLHVAQLRKRTSSM